MEEVEQIFYNNRPLQGHISLRAYAEAQTQEYVQRKLSIYVFYNVSIARWIKAITGDADLLLHQKRRNSRS